MADTFENHESSLDSPAQLAASVTPADTDLPNVARGLYVGGAGDVVVYMVGSTTEVTFAGVTAGSILPIRVSQVRAATSATNIVALW